MCLSRTRSVIFYLCLCLRTNHAEVHARMYVVSLSTLCCVHTLVLYSIFRKLDFPRVTFWGREPKKDASCRYVTVWVTSLQQYFIWAACLISIKSLVDNTDWGYIIITLLLWGTAFFASSAKNTQIECFILPRFSSESSRVISRTFWSLPECSRQVPECSGWYTN